MMVDEEKTFFYTRPNPSALAGVPHLPVDDLNELEPEERTRRI
jgi:hypothetical protein